MKKSKWTVSKEIQHRQSQLNRILPLATSTDSPAIKAVLAKCAKHFTRPVDPKNLHS